MLIYSGYSAAIAAQWTGSSGIWDREHLWPQSYGLVVLSANSRARTDVFQSAPVRCVGEFEPPQQYYDVMTPPGSSYPDAPESSYDSDSWEPRPADKGPIARSMFYMAVRYDGTDPDVPDLELAEIPNPAMARFGKLSTLLAWHRQYPATEAERARNHTVFTAYQHNRNPFVDHPEFADMVFSGASLMDAWRAVHFTAAELANPALSGPAANLDHDGFVALLEYAFRSDPRRPSAGQPLTMEIAKPSRERPQVLCIEACR